MLIVLHVSALALGLWLSHPSRRWLFAEHMVVALHLFAFLILFIELVSLPGARIVAALGGTGVPTSFKLTCAVVLTAYVARALRVVYGRNVWLCVPAAAALLMFLGLFSVVVYRTVQFLVIFAAT